MRYVKQRTLDARAEALSAVKEDPEANLVGVRYALDSAVRVLEAKKTLVPLSLFSRDGDLLQVSLTRDGVGETVTFNADAVELEEYSIQGLRDWLTDWLDTYGTDNKENTP